VKRSSISGGEGRNPRRRLIAAVASVVALAAAAGALAYFGGAGFGIGTTTVGTAAPVTLSPATAAADLAPGASSDVALTVSNPNPVAVHIASLELDPSQGTAGFSVDSAHSGCATSALAFTSASNGGAGWSVPAKVGQTDGSLSLDLADAFSMTTSAAAACQGATFTVYLTVGN
jgi:hypothetical protein